MLALTLYRKKSISITQPFNTLGCCFLNTCLLWATPSCISIFINTILAFNLFPGNHDLQQFFSSKRTSNKLISLFTALHLFDALSLFLTQLKLCSLKIITPSYVASVPLPHSHFMVFVKPQPWLDLSLSLHICSVTTSVEVNVAGENHNLDAWFDFIFMTMSFK